MNMKILREHMNVVNALMESDEEKLRILSHLLWNAAKKDRYYPGSMIDFFVIAYRGDRIDYYKDGDKFYQNQIVEPPYDDPIRTIEQYEASLVLNWVNMMRDDILLGNSGNDEYNENFIDYVIDNTTLDGLIVDIQIWLSNEYSDEEGGEELMSTINRIDGMQKISKIIKRVQRSNR